MNRDMIVDLTPLLDVVLILLFMILTSQSESTQQTIQVLQEEVQQLEHTQLPANQSEQAWLNTFQESIGKLNIVFPTNTSEEDIFAIGPNDYLDVKSDTEDLQNWLLEQIEPLTEDVVIVTFSYNNDQIYYQDYLNMINAITSLDSLVDQTIVYREEMVNELLTYPTGGTEDE